MKQLTNLLARRGVNARIYALVVIFGVSCAALAAALVWLQGQRAIAARQHGLESLVDVAIGVLDAHKKLADAGAMPVEEAKARALKVIENMRYGNGDYFFARNLDGITVMNAAAPQTVGTNRDQVTDSRGHYYVREMTDVVRKNGQGFVNYVFKKPGKNYEVDKTTFLKLYKPWGIAIGSGVYVDDVQDELNGAMLQAGGVTLALIALLSLVAFWIARGITRPLGRLRTAMQALAENRASSATPELERADEIGEMARAVEVFRKSLAETDRLRNEQAEIEGRTAAQHRADMNRIADEFQTAVGNIIDAVSSAATELEASAGTLTKTAETTQEITGSVVATSEQASANVQTVAAATEEMAASVGEIARQAQTSSEIARQAVTQAEKTDARITKLSQAANRIGDVVKLITAIAEQTNLLALNATIEAARAGEAGKGFAVVAQEVKALATQTAKATDEIRGQISAMQAVTQESVADIKQIGDTIGRISEIAEAIAETVAQQGSATQEISRNVQEAARGTSDVASNVANVSRGASETGSASAQVLAAARSLASDSNHLKLEVEKFLATVRAA
jgi:methyl-accepting chemotaxis protein